MIKKCIGCGIKLQIDNVDKPGYTKDLTMDYCMRCFKLKNYNELINNGINIDNDKLLKSINKKKIFVFFLVDYLNICEEVIDIYKKITSNKVLLITKSDLIYKNIIKEDLITNIKRVYKIKEDILFINTKNNENLNKVISICEKNKKVIVTGFTNAGKSSLINALVGSKITVSSIKNTTQDFIKMNNEGVTIYDAPGFMTNNFLDNMFSKNGLLPIVYQMEPEYFLRFNNICIYFNDKCNITMFINRQIIAKLRVKEEVDRNITIPDNSDLVIKGIGFIRFKNKTKIALNVDKCFYEIRPTIVGGNYE